MGYRVKGTLKLPDGSPASNAEIEFISRKNFSPLVQELKSNILCGLDGAYDVTLEYGEYAVMVYPGGTYPAALGTIVLAADTVAGQDLPTLLKQSGWQPATPEYIQQIGAWLVEANASATSSAASAGAAKVSETNAKASENAALSSKNSAASSASTATTKASEAASSASAALASKNAAAASEANALASKNSAATSATTASAGASTATTKAGEASASAAAAKVSQDAAKVSETNAAASAGTAASAIVAHEGKAGAHPIGGVMGLQAALDGKYSPANKPTAADIQNVVSPVSSGGIIERGSNANGEYVKFADGTMFCSLANFNIPATALNTNFTAGLYLPAAFASIDDMKPVASILSTNSGSFESAGELYRNGFILKATDVSQILFNGYTYVSPIKTPLTIGVVVWGHWK